MGKFKERIRELSRKYEFVEAIWLLIHFAKVKLRMRMNDVEFVSKQYKGTLGRELDLNNPKRFSEKLCFLKLSNRDPC